MYRATALLASCPNGMTRPKNRDHSPVGMNHAATPALGIRAIGVQIVASAGNEGANVDDTDCFFACWESGGYGYPRPGLELRQPGRRYLGILHGQDRPGTRPRRRDEVANGERHQLFRTTGHERTRSRHCGQPVAVWASGGRPCGDSSARWCRARQADPRCAISGKKHPHCTKPICRDHVPNA